VGVTVSSRRRPCRRRRARAPPCELGVERLGSSQRAPRYRRGGLQDGRGRLRRLAELYATQLARRRGVPTGEVLGACVEWRSFGLYRGVLVSRAADGYTNWWAWLTTRPSPQQRRQLVRAVARVIARLHTAGIQHADLNLTNVLVRFEAETPRVLLIDFDRAGVFPAPLHAARRRRSLRRLQRSIKKLDPHGQYFSAQDLDALLNAYRQCRADEADSVRSVH